MISIAEAISDLLYMRDTVVVPGLGAFVKKPISAKANPVANYFTKPSCELEFNAKKRDDNDLVINYLSNKNNIPEDEARRLLIMFVTDCFNTLKSGKDVTLNQIGTLSFDWAGDIAFEQEEAVNYNADAFGLCDFTSIPILQSKSKSDIKAEIEQQQKDKNTPMTVDEKAVHEDDEKPKSKINWKRILLALLLLAVFGFGLHYLQIVNLNPLKVRIEKPSKIDPWTVVVPTEVKTWQTTQEAQETDSVIVEQEQKTEQKTEQEALPVVVQETETVQETEIVQETEPVVIEETESLIETEPVVMKKSGPADVKDTRFAVVKKAETVFTKELRPAFLKESRVIVKKRKPVVMNGTMSESTEETEPEAIEETEFETVEETEPDAVEEIEPEVVEEIEPEVVEEIKPEAVEEIKPEVPKETEPVVVQQPKPVNPEAKIRIIAGCFSQEENAEKLANQLKDKGFNQTFVEKRGSKWFVSFGRYATMEEADTALREIKEKGETKAWIMK